MSKITLMHGECIEKMKDIKDGSIDMVMCDPPYGTTACKWDTIIPLCEMWKQLKRICKNNAAIVMCSAQPFTSVLVMSNPKMFRYGWVWEKEQGVNFLMAKKHPMKVHEDLCVFYKHMPIYNPQMTEGKPYIRGGDGTSGDVSGNVKKKKTVNKGLRYPRSIQRINRETGLHPTQKPVGLMEYMIKTYTNPGETVLDFTMGSGTTGVACKNLDRSFVGIEKDDEYFKIAKERIEQA